MVNGAETGADADWAGSRTAVAMALCGDAPSRTCGRAVGDPARTQRTQDDVRPQVGSWHSTTRTLDWSNYPLKTPSGAASAPISDGRTTPANGCLASEER